jgi:hypothetical protein
MHKSINRSIDPAVRLGAFVGYSSELVAVVIAKRGVCRVWGGVSLIEACGASLQASRHKQHGRIPCLCVCLNVAISKSPPPPSLDRQAAVSLQQSSS